MRTGSAWFLNANLIAMDGQRTRSRCLDREELFRRRGWADGDGGYYTGRFLSINSARQKQQRRSQSRGKHDVCSRKDLIEV